MLFQFFRRTVFQPVGLHGFLFGALPPLTFISTPSIVAVWHVDALSFTNGSSIMRRKEKESRKHCSHPAHRSIFNSQRESVSRRIRSQALDFGVRNIRSLMFAAAHRPVDSKRRSRRNFDAKKVWNIQFKYWLGFHWTFRWLIKIPPSALLGAITTRLERPIITNSDFLIESRTPEDSRGTTRRETNETIGNESRATNRKWHWRPSGWPLRWRH